MAYTINKTDGNVLVTVSDGTINTSSSSITLIGKNYAGYGEFQNENFVKLLENAASSSAPATSLTGQIWYDKTNNLLKVFNGTVYRVISGATAAASAPTGQVAGDLWYDTANAQLKVYNGTSNILVGPSYSATTGTSGAIVDTVIDSGTGASHVVVKVYAESTVVAIYSKDATFTPTSPITGFATIGPGLNLSTAVSSAVFKGTSTNAELLDNLNSTDFLRANVNTTTSGTLSVLNDTGLYVGVDDDIRMYVSGAVAYLKNQTDNGNLSIQVNKSGVSTTCMTFVGSTGDVSITGNVVNGNTNGVGNIGSSAVYFNTVFAKATSAYYADLAERFATDHAYPAGTVVELGGTAEITQVVDDLSDKVFGVISTSPSYLMNSTVGTDETHPPVALAGRVPVRVVGKVKKGDRLVSAGNGVARSAANSELTAFNTIGRALEDKHTEVEAYIEVIVVVK